MRPRATRWASRRSTGFDRREFALFYWRAVPITARLERWGSGILVGIAVRFGPSTDEFVVLAMRADPEPMDAARHR